MSYLPDDLTALNPAELVNEYGETARRLGRLQNSHSERQAMHQRHALTDYDALAAELNRRLAALTGADAAAPAKGRAGGRIDLRLTYARLVELDRSGEQPVAVPLVQRYTLRPEEAVQWLTAWENGSTFIHSDHHRDTHIRMTEVALVETTLHRTSYSEGAPLCLWLTPGGQLVISYYDPDQERGVYWAVPAAWAAERVEYGSGWAQDVHMVLEENEAPWDRLDEAGGTGAWRETGPVSDDTDDGSILLASTRHANEPGLLAPAFDPRHPEHVVVYLRAQAEVTE